MAESLILINSLKNDSFKNRNESPLYSLLQFCLKLVYSAVGANKGERGTTFDFLSLCESTWVQSISFYPH